jgi:hypothetical protein
MEQFQQSFQLDFNPVMDISEEPWIARYPSYTSEQQEFEFGNYN